METHGSGSIITHCFDLGYCEEADKKHLIAWSQVAIGNSELAAWNYLFDGGWTCTDNTPDGSAVRLRYAATYGIPMDWEKQIAGTALLSYLHLKK